MDESKMDAIDLSGALGSLKDYLNPEIFIAPDTAENLSRSLQDGKLISIRNAFKESFANRIYNCLDQFNGWKVYEAYKDFFHYHHHNIYDENLFPADLRWCQQVFQHPKTKQWIEQLSQRDCSGEVQFSASYYLPGDHSLPHNDLVPLGEDQWRQVAYVWHLSKNWESTWGGHFYWCAQNRYLSPSFNTLLVFNVGPDTKHFVTVVSPYAQSKRLAVNGWWTGKASPISDSTHPEVESPLIEII
jgi:hypothetical protein